MCFHHLQVSVGFQQTVLRTQFPPPPLHLYRFQKFLLWSLMSSQKTWKPGQRGHSVLGTQEWSMGSSSMGTQATPHLSCSLALCLTLV